MTSYPLSELRDPPYSGMVKIAQYDKEGNEIFQTVQYNHVTYHGLVVHNLYTSFRGGLFLSNRKITAQMEVRHLVNDDGLKLISSTSGYNHAKDGDVAVMKQIYRYVPENNFELRSLGIFQELSGGNIAAVTVVNVTDSRGRDAVSNLVAGQLLVVEYTVRIRLHANNFRPITFQYKGKNITVTPKFVNTYTASSTIMASSSNSLQIIINDRGSTTWGNEFILLKFSPHEQHYRKLYDFINSGRLVTPDDIPVSMAKIIITIHNVRSTPYSLYGFLLSIHGIQYQFDLSESIEITSLDEITFEIPFNYSTEG